MVPCVLVGCVCISVCATYDEPQVFTRCGRTAILDTFSLECEPITGFSACFRVAGPGHKMTNLSTAFLIEAVGRPIARGAISQQTVAPNRRSAHCCYRTLPG